MGPAPSLGLSTFTLEAWVLRNGPGKTASTGLGGVSMSPVISKGRGEGDGSPIDCNYAFGFSGEVLAADFEDMQLGANHPIVGKTPLPLGTWHHLAATYDGSTWRLYIDGELDAQKKVDALPRHDSLQHFGLGAAFNTEGQPAGGFDGLLDEVRVWNYARSAAELRASMFEQPGAQEGLVSYWDFDDEDAADLRGSSPGTLSGAGFDRGIAMNRGAPAGVLEGYPADAQVVSSAGATLEIAVDEADGKEHQIRYYLREITAEDDFAMAVLPSTLHYTTAAARNGYFYDQTGWITDNREARNIVGVIHTGDVISRAAEDSQWNVATAAMAILEEPGDGIPNGLPYSMAIGNRDQNPLGTPGATAAFNRFFGKERFKNRDYYGGSIDGKNDNSWIHFKVRGLEVVVVSLEYDVAQKPAVLTWAKSVFARYPSALGIVNVHFSVQADGAFGAQGQKIYDALKGVANLQLMTSGHVSGERVRTDVFQGNTVHSILGDFHALDDGGTGFMRLLQFSPASNTLRVQTYSPTLDQYQTDADSDFLLDVDLRGTGGAFLRVATVDGGEGTTAASIDLKPGATYEWYAEIDDCDNMVRSETRRFTTSN